MSEDVFYSKPNEQKNLQCYVSWEKFIKGLIHRESVNSEEIYGSKFWFSSPLLVYISRTVLKNMCGVMSCQHKNFQNFKGPFLFWLYITWIHTTSFAFPRNSFVCRKMGGSVGRMRKKKLLFYSLNWIIWHKKKRSPNNLFLRPDPFASSHFSFSSRADAEKRVKDLLQNSSIIPFSNFRARGR